MTRFVVGLGLLVSTSTLAAALASCSDPGGPRGEPDDLTGVLCNGQVASKADLQAAWCNVASCSDYKPTINGCGPQQSLSGYVAAQIAQGPFPFTSCCNTHDVAYGTCNGPAFGAGQTAADNALKTCMLNLCQNSYPGRSATGAAIWRACCTKAANLIYKAVNVAGSNAYWGGQRLACTCAAADAGVDAATASKSSSSSSPADGGSMDAAIDGAAADGGGASPCPVDDPWSCPAALDWYNSQLDGGTMATGVDAAAYGVVEPDLPGETDGG